MSQDCNACLALKYTLELCEGSRNRYAQTVFPPCEAAKCRVVQKDVMFSSGWGENWVWIQLIFEVTVDGSHLTCDI